MRLIDVDAAIDRYYAEYKKQDICDGAEDRDWLMRCISEAPIIDAGPIVRCKDCKFYKCGVCIRKTKQGGKHAVDRVSANFFCAAGRLRASVVLDREEIEDERI